MASSSTSSLHGLAVDSAVRSVLYEDGLICDLEEAGTEKEENLPPRLTAPQVARIMHRIDTLHGSSGAVDVDGIVNRYKELIEDRNQLRRLRQAPGIKQRTPEWYEARHALITASDIAQALGQGKFGTQKQFMVKKVETPPPPPGKDDPPSAFVTLPPLKWGTMFEDVAAAIYTMRTGMRIYDFGLLRHSDPMIRIGASPDGITDMGVMLEIKCPFRRRITGEVPLQYYYQIQGQLEVCGLRYCDYLECEFSEYKNEQEFKVDVLDSTDDVLEEDELDGKRRTLSRFGLGCNGREKGAIAEYCSPDGHNVYYKYGKLAPSEIEHDQWMRDRLNEGPGADDDRSCLKRLHFWRLEIYSIVRVGKDEGMVKEMLTELDTVWERVLEFRDNPELFQQHCGDRTKTDAIISTQPPTSSNSKKAVDSSSSCFPPPAVAQENNTETSVMSDYAFVDED